MDFWLSDSEDIFLKNDFEIGNLVLLTKDSHHKFHNQSVTREEVVNKRDELWKVNNPKEYKKYTILKAYLEEV